MNKRYGFTLAEVLITLGIIGVVAAMTIPTLIANTNGAKYRSQFKKTLSTLNQAALMSVAQYEFDFSGATSTCGATSGTDAANENPASGTMSFCSLLNGTLSGATYTGALNSLSRSNGTTGTTAYSITVKSTSSVLPSNSVADYHGFSLADGSIVAFYKDAATCTLSLGSTTSQLVSLNSKCVGFIDVNGTTLPNTEINCTSGTTGIIGTSCTVENNAANMTDVFPVVYHDATVEPATNAAQYVLTTSK